MTRWAGVFVMDWCCHGTVDETLAVLDGDRVVPRPGAPGPQVDVAQTTRWSPHSPTSGSCCRRTVTSRRSAGSPGSTACSSSRHAAADRLAHHELAAYGLTDDVAARLGPAMRGHEIDVAGPRDGAAAAAAVDDELEAFMHLWALNRGILLTPFHDMALFSPHHTEADVDLHTEVFAEAVGALLGG